MPDLWSVRRSAPHSRAASASKGSGCLSQGKSKSLSADLLFFPAAAALAVIAMSGWLAILQGWISAPGPYWHGHEMLLGYAFAVVSGYLITRVSLVTVGLLFVS